MIVCILQPSYIPWKGFFHQIAKSDVFVFLDTVQYDRRGWRNRNKIKTPNGPAWLTIPVEAKGSHDGLLIKDVPVVDASWANNHLLRIKQCYKQAPFFKQEFSWLEALYAESAQSFSQLSDITISLTKAIAAHIGINDTKFVVASSLDITETDPTQRLVAIAKANRATTYLSGPSAQNYLDEEAFRAAGMDVAWMSYDYPEYTQLYPPFSHQVSIIDMLMMLGVDETANTICRTNSVAV